MLTSRLVPSTRLEPDPTLDRYQRFGIELEYENARRNVQIVGLPWTAARDGSLRNNGIELVSRPLKFRDVRPSVRAICDAAAAAGLVVSPRCGAHVHVNMRPYNLGQIFSAICGYGLLEPSLFGEFAEGRQNSAFCVPQYSNTALQNAVTADIAYNRHAERGGLGNSLRTNKYSALNLLSLGTFGTLEARHLAGTLNPTVVVNFVACLKRLVDYSVQFDDPIHLLDEYERVGLGALQAEIIGAEPRVNAQDQRDAEIAVTIMAGEDLGEMIDPPPQQPIPDPMRGRGRFMAYYDN